MDIKEYKKSLAFYGEKLAYLCFTQTGYKPFEDRGVTYEDIDKFDATFFFTNIINDEGEEEVEFNIRFTVTMDGSARGDSITSLYENRKYQDAIIDQIYNRDFGSYQYYTFVFGKPNAMQLFDAEFILDEKLGFEDEDEADY